MRLLLIIFIGILTACSSASKYAIDVNDVHAWCIVPFDSEKRTPHERIAMLKLIGINSYAYDWREVHLEEMAIEWELAKVNEIEIEAVWLWIDANNDSISGLSASNEKLFAEIDEFDLETQIWVGFNNNYFEGLSDAAAVAKGVEIITYLNKRAAKLKCTIGLYNHGDWFGEPENQIKILQSSGLEKKVGLIYNFHHGHHHIDRFEALVDNMLPYLWTVNLNGMEKDGSKILPIGEGDYEKEMIEILYDSGYDGPYGILGHVDTADVKEVLKGNIRGLKNLFSE